GDGRRRVDPVRGCVLREAARSDDNPHRGRRPEVVHPRSQRIPGPRRPEEVDRGGGDRPPHPRRPLLRRVFELVFYHPEIPPNTGNAMRLAAVTGCRLHLIEPLGFTLDDAKLRRAGMDYRDRATVTVHPDLDACAAALSDRRVFAFTVDARTLYTDFAYLTGDVFLFGPESVGLPDEAQRHPWVTERVRIPMVAGVRSLNLSNAAAVAVYEAWRQHGFAGAVGS